jgi:cytochrome c553
MKPKPALAIVVMLVMGAAAPADVLGGEDAETFFETRVRPVLATRCFKCHGGEKTSSGLRVDSREALVQGGDSGAAIVPGDAEASPLVRAIRRGEELKMPPDEPLSAEAVADLARWVEQGAPWPAKAGAKAGLSAGRHWSFEPVRAVTVPADPSGWAETPIDCLSRPGTPSTGCIRSGRPIGPRC